MEYQKIINLLDNHQIRYVNLGVKIGLTLDFNIKLYWH